VVVLLAPEDNYFVSDHSHTATALDVSKNPTHPSSDMHPKKAAGSPWRKKPGRGAEGLFHRL